MRNIWCATLLMCFAALASGCKPELGAKPEVGQSGAIGEGNSAQTPAVPVAHAAAALSEKNWASELGWVNPDAMVDGRTSISTARSLEEAQWLQRHGFLTKAKIEHFNKLGFSAVYRLAKAGDNDALLYVGERMVMDGEGKRIIGALDHLIEKQGSIPALHLRARYKVGLITKVPKDLPTSSMEWRDAMISHDQEKADVASDYFAAYLLGDYRGAQFVSKMYAYSEGGVAPVVFTMASQKVTQIANARASLPGAPPIRLDPRPMPQDARGADDY
jgi:hypothetical protein